MVDLRRTQHFLPTPAKKGHVLDLCACVKYKPEIKRRPFVFSTVSVQTVKTGLKIYYGVVTRATMTAVKSQRYVLIDAARWLVLH